MNVSVSRSKMGQLHEGHFSSPRSSYHTDALLQQAGARANRVPIAKGIAGRKVQLGISSPGRLVKTEGCRKEQRKPMCLRLGSETSPEEKSLSHLLGRSRLRRNGSLCDAFGQTTILSHSFKMDHCLL